MNIRRKGAIAVVLATLLLLPFELFAQKAAPPDPVAAASENLAPPTTVYELPTIDLENLPPITPGPTMTLQDAFAAADRNNGLLNAGRQEIEKVRGMLAQALAYVLPMVEGSIDYQRKDKADKVDFSQVMGSLSGLVSAAPTIQTEMTIYPIDELKGVLKMGFAPIHPEGWATIAAARKGIEFAEMSVEDGRQELMVNVATAYYLSLEAKWLIEMRKAFLESATHHLKVATSHFKAGAGLKVDVIRAEADLEQARQDLLTAYMALEQARDALRYMTGTKDPPMSVEAPPVTEPVGEAGDLVSKAAANHRGFNAKKLNVELKDKQLSAAWMKFVPHLEAGWGMNYFFTQPSQLQDQTRARWAFLVSLKWPIFTMQSLGAVKVAKAELRKAQLELEDAERKLNWDVRQARRDYITALSSVQIADKWSKLANDGLRLIRASFEVGTSSSLDVTDAQRTASMAAVNLGAKRLDAQIALMKLLRAMGNDIPDALNVAGTALMPVAEAPAAPPEPTAQ